MQVKTYIEPRSSAKSFVLVCVTFYTTKKSPLFAPRAPFPLPRRRAVDEVFNLLSVSELSLVNFAIVLI
jgi:hypothetical protein